MLAILLGSLAMGCSKGTYLELRFSGAGLPEVDSIEVQLTLTPPNGGATLTSRGAVSLPNDAAIPLPTEMVFKLDSETGALRIDATAMGPGGGRVATATATTDIRHGQTWTVELGFASAGAVADAGADGGQPPGGDATVSPDSDGDSGADDGRGIVVTDGSLADGSSGCAALTLAAIETVSLDYNNIGAMVDAGNMLWATVQIQQHYIGWMKFGLRTIPSTFRVMSASLNLNLTTASGVAPMLLVEYSSFDGWTRRTASNTNLTVTTAVSGTFGTPKGGVNVYQLDADSGSHSWQSDIVDGTVTLGIDNKIMLAVGQSSVVQFAGVDAVNPVGDNRPTLDLVVCH